MTDKFNIFIPFEIEKSGKTGEDRYKNMKIKGIASNPNLGKDKQDQWLDPSGFDFTDFMKSGFLNWHHLWKDKPQAIVGEPTKASITKGNEFYIEGQLYSDSPVARELYDLAEVLQKNSKTRKLGFSIEGRPTLVDPNDKNRILKAKITQLAITPAPICPGTSMELMKGGLDERSYETEKDSEYLIDITDDNGVRWTVDGDLNIEKGGPGSGRKSKGFKWSSIGQHHSGKQYVVGAHPKTGKTAFGVWNKEKDEYVLHHDLDFHPELKKAMVAGDITGANTTNKNLTQEPLKQESVEGKRKKKLKDLMKRKGEKLTKAETLTLLVNDFDFDKESALNVWGLIERVEKNLTR